MTACASSGIASIFLSPKRFGVCRPRTSAQRIPRRLPQLFEVIAQHLFGECAWRVSASGRPSGAAPRLPRTLTPCRNRPSLLLRVLRTTPLSCGLRPVVVAAEDLEHHGDVLLVLQRVANVALSVSIHRSA